MQTFLPHPNFTLSVMTLDTKRLGKQRVEARQIQRAIQDVRMLSDQHEHLTPDWWSAARSDAALANGCRHVPWSGHPAVIMWRNHVQALMLYGDCCIREWVRRGHSNTMPPMLAGDHERIPSSWLDVEMPVWLGRDDLHASHRSRLLQKDPEHYGQFDWDDPTDLEYVWPVE